MNFLAVKDYDFRKSPYPVIVCGIILLLFGIAYIFSMRQEKREQKVAAV